MSSSCPDATVCSSITLATDTASVPDMYRLTQKGTKMKQAQAEPLWGNRDVVKNEHLFVCVP